MGKEGKSSEMERTVIAFLGVFALLCVMAAPAPVMAAEGINIIEDWNRTFGGTGNIDLLPIAIGTPPTVYAHLTNTISATIKNNGTDNASSFNISLSADGNPVDKAGVSGLSAGESVVVSFSWIPYRTGDFELCVAADCDLGVVEYNESNNVLCKNVIVSPPNFWESDCDIISGLGDIGSRSAPTVFNKDGTWYLIAGESELSYYNEVFYEVGFYGYNWTGSEWQSDSAIVLGLPEPEPGGEEFYRLKPTVFNKDGTWYLIFGEGGGTFFGWNWTGSGWQSDSAIVSGLGDVGKNSAPTVFCKDGTWYLIAGELYGAFYGYHWTGSGWQSDPAIVSGLEDVGYASAPAVFNKDGTWYLISGESKPYPYYGFKWTGSVWEPDSAIVSGLKSDPGYTQPTVFYKDWTWYLISGAGDGRFYGFHQVIPGIEWRYVGLIMPWDAERLPGNNTLITEFGNHTVLEVTPDKQIVWRYGDGTAGSGKNQLNCPVDAERLANGNTLITDSNNHRVIEVNQSKEVVWEMTGLNYPLDAERLANNNTLITDRNINRVIEVNQDKEIVWEMTVGLNHPEDAERLPNNNTLITDYRNHRVIEVNPDKEIVWQYGTTGVSGSGVNQLNYPTDAERLPGGNTLIADYSSHRVIEVSMAKEIAGQYGTGTAGSGANELNHPTDVERLSNGNTLIAEAGNNRIIEVFTLPPLPPIAPKIISFAPPSPVYDAEGAVRSFNITIDQEVNVSWQIDGTEVQTNVSVTEARYTDTSATVGTWNVAAIASNVNGTAMQKWDWRVRLLPGPDLTVSMIDAYHNETFYPREIFPPYFNLSNEVDVKVENVGTETVGAFNVSLYAGAEFIDKRSVSGLGVGNSTVVQFKWTPTGKDCEKGGSPQTYTLKATADCDNDVNESDETNNESATSETAYWAGYSADEHINAVAWHGMLRGGLNYTTGDGEYSGLYSPGDTATTHYDITLPAGASVELARLNVYYTWSKADYPVMEVSITNASGTYVVPLAASYNDRPCPSPAISFEYPFGNYVYDLTPYIQGSGTYTYTVTVENAGPGGCNFCIAAPGLVILYEDTTEPEREFWILEGADLLEGGRRGGAGYLALEECICNGTFTGDIDTGKVENATLGIVSAWGGSAWGAEHTSYYWFNDCYLGDGSILGGYNSLYDKTVDGMSMHVDSAQVGVNVSDVTAYIASENNTVSFGDDGDSMMACNAFLIVEYGAGKSPAPFFVYGFVNDSEGVPVNGPNVTITNLNTGKVFTAEKNASSNYFQVLTSSGNVSAGNVLNFYAGNNKGNSTEFNHTITEEDVNIGVFEQDIVIIVEAPSPCFIATAAYGTTLHEDIDILRDFRDERLMTNPLGRTFVKTYYTTSPPIADALREHEGLRTAVRETLIKPLVYVSRMFVTTDYTD